MSAETLRRAASLMRERAEAATEGVCPAWTAAAVRHIARNCDIDCEYLSCEHTEADDDAGRSGSAAGWDRYDDAEYIASWHPAVALKVAASLDQAAGVIAEAESGPLAMAMNAIAEPLVAVARAYLGEVDA